MALSIFALRLSWFVVAIGVTPPIEDIIGYPYQHDHLEAPFFDGGFEARFPLIDRLISLPFHDVKEKYGPPEAAGELWNDLACPAFLINQDVTVCGNLVIRGRLTIVTAANTSVFEEFAGTAAEDLERLKTSKLSAFARERCTRKGPSDAISCFGDGGSIFIPNASLLISGRLTVFGSVFAATLTMDSASSLAAGVGSFLGLHSVPRPTEKPTELPLRFGKGRSRRAFQPPETRTLEPVMAQSILPDHSSRNDPFCEERRGKLPEALFMPRGMLFMRNNAALFTFGRSVVRTVGLDKGSEWLSRCAPIVVADEIGESGDMALLAASSIYVSGEDQVTSVGNLAVMEGSFMGVQGGLDVKELVKVTTSGSLTIGGALQAFDVAVADSAVLSVIRSSLIKELVLVSGAELRFGLGLEVLSVEAYDNARIYVNKPLTVLEYLVADDGATISALDGNVNVGTLLLANHSSIAVGGQRSALTVGEDIKAKNGAGIQAQAINVGCSVILDQHSSMDVSSELRIRNHDFSTPRHPVILPNITESFPIACLREQPALLVQKSNLRVTESVLLGGRRVFRSEADADEKPIVSIISQGTVSVGAFQARGTKQALVLKGESKLTLLKPAPPTSSVLSPGRMVTLESGSTLRAIGIDVVDIGLLEITQGSRALLGAGIVKADWISVSSRSHFEVMGNTDFHLEKGLDVTDHSSAELNGFWQTGDAFDHVLAQTGSSVRWYGRCQPRQDGTGLIEVRGQFVAQDMSELIFGGVVGTGPMPAVITAETHSIVHFSCPFDNQRTARISFRQTPEAEFIALQSALPTAPTMYLLKVPPADAASLQAFARDSVAHHALQKKNLFWDSWQKALDFERVQLSSSNSSHDKIIPNTPGTGSFAAVTEKDQAELARSRRSTRRGGRLNSQYS